MANRLAGETSPYLLQHSENPVDWYPWGPEALRRAREEDRPILLSVGYSACHWCHVMERESFEDPVTAAYMNEHFVNVKVDREERPDVDAIYMEAVQAMSGHGGWPMTVFLDPDGVPFYGGTYFPPDESRGMPSFRMVMEAVLDAFERRRSEIDERAAATRERLRAAGAVDPSPDLPSPADLDRALELLLSDADRVRGGFGGAPKFPPPSALELLLSWAVGASAGRGRPEALAVVEETLDGMLAGGIYDQLGGGFARYSVDATWLVPHFEKMLYDNALLARAYLHGWQVLGRPRYRRVCEETLDWMLREMRGPEGGFFSAYDADSEGEEGRFYVWTPTQIRAALTGGRAGGGDGAADGAAGAAAGAGGAVEGSAGGTLGAEPEARPTAGAGAVDVGAVIDHYGVGERGNFEGANVLHLAHGAAAPAPAGLEEARRALYGARARRVWPGLDEKRLCAWNALAIGALADAGAVLGRPDYLAAARRCAELVLGSMRNAEGRLLRTYKDGEARLDAYLEDHAFLLEALLALYEADFEPRWFEAAHELAGTMIARFSDPERGGFFSTASDHEELIVRRKEIGDHPIPSGNSSAALGLLRLAALTGEPELERQAEGVLRLFAQPALRHPGFSTHLLRALDFHLSPRREVALIAPAGGPPIEDERAGGRASERGRAGERGQATPGAPPGAPAESAGTSSGLERLAAVLRSSFRPHLVLAGGSEGSRQPPLLAARTAIDDRPTAYVCERFACRLPITDPEDLRRELTLDGESPL